MSQVECDASFYHPSIMLDKAILVALLATGLFLSEG